MYKDIINYELEESTTQTQLLDVAQKIYSSWMSKQHGFISWEINQDKAGSYVDVVSWRSKEDAYASNADMKNIPSNLADSWFACYKKGSIKSQNLSRLSILKK